MTKICACFVLGVMSLLTAAANAAPLSRCGLEIHRGGFACTAFESLADEAALENSRIFSMSETQQGMTANNIVLPEHPDSPDTDTQKSDGDDSTNVSILSSGINADSTNILGDFRENENENEDDPVTPEPASVALFSLGGIALLMFAKKARRAE
jgi:hypothetical protein